VKAALFLLEKYYFLGKFFISTNVWKIKKEYAIINLSYKTI